MPETSDTFFDCRETPVWFPTDFSLDTVPDCPSCTLRLTAELGGPGHVQAHPIGLTVDESTQVTFTVNGIQHSLEETLLVIKGAHRLPGQQTVSAAELQLYCKNVQDFTKRVCLAIPVVIGKGRGNAYFSKLDQTVRADRPRITTLLREGAPVYSYRGADMRVGRTAKTPQPRAQCDPVASVLTWYVCEEPAQILAQDLARLVDLAGAAALEGPPTPVTAVSASRARALVTRIESGIKLDVGRTGDSEKKGVSTEAVKCYRIDKTRDIVDNKLYIGGKKEATPLSKELEQAATEFEKRPQGGSVQPGDIEKGIAITLGVLFGIAACVFFWYFVIRKTAFSAEEIAAVPAAALAATGIRETVPVAGAPRAVAALEAALANAGH